MMNSSATRWAAAIGITALLVAISSSLAAQWLNDMLAHVRQPNHEWVVPPWICIILLCVMSEWLFPAAMHLKNWELHSVGRGGLIGAGGWLVMMRLVKFYLKTSWVEFFPIYGVLCAPIASFIGALACLIARLWFRKLRRSRE
jgi:uncharacterized BrkB/YihY/UPF0761 family membrane protein